MSEQISLVKYSTDKNIGTQQATKILELVQQKRNYLEKDPDRKLTAMRYLDEDASVSSQKRTATNTGIDAFTIVDNLSNRCEGIATVIFNVSVMHPDVGIVAGHNLDYWLSESSSDELHREVAEKLVILCKEKFSSFVFPDIILDKIKDDFSFFSAVQNDSVISPLGFTRATDLGVDPNLAMKPYGDMKKLKLPKGEKDIFEVAAKGRKTQLYLVKP